MTRVHDRGQPRRRSGRQNTKGEVKTAGRTFRAIPAEVQSILTESRGVRRAEQSVPSTMAAENVAQIFNAVSDPARLRILGALDRSPLCPCLLLEVEPMKNSALSYHLRILKRAGLVTMSAKSNYRIYEATALGGRLTAFARQVLRL